MKKFKLFALAALFCGMSSSAFAQSKADGHYRYEILSGTTAEIIGFVANNEVAAVEIPVQVQDPDDATKQYDVVAVAVEAFKGQTGITSVTIPDTKVTTIKGGAFAGCTNLTTVTIGKAVTLIDNATTFADFGAGTTVVDDVYYLSVNGDGKYTETTATAVAAGDRYVGGTPVGAFAGCTKLATVTFNAAAAAQEIAAGTFIGTAITNLDLTNTKVSRIERLFTDGGSNKTNAKLAEVTFPAVMGTVVNDAFNGCSALATVNFVTPTVATQAINAGAFVGTAIETLDLSGSKVTEINQLFTDGTTTSNAKLATVKLAKTTTAINYRAFYGCAKLSEIVWATDGTLATIWGNAFEVTPTLKSLEIPASVTALNYNFLYGSSITSLTINANATAGPAIGVSGSTKLKTLTVKNAFKGNIAGTVDTYVQLDAAVALVIDETYFTAADGSTSIVYDGSQAANDGTNYWILIPAEYAFETLESVTFEGNLEGTIGANAFGGTKLTTATFKGTIAANAIGTGAFSGATKLATVNFEKKINANGVDAGAFDGAGSANIGTTKLTVNYSPAAADEVANAFNVAAFAASDASKFVAMVTTTTYGSSIIRPYAVTLKFDAASVEVELANNGSGSWYYAKFYKPNDYSIAKEQEGGAKVIVYGAYVDNKDANIYMEQLHIIDGNYEIPAFTPVIIKSDKNEKVKAVSGISTTNGGMLLANDNLYSNEISSLGAVTIGQLLKENTNDFDNAGRAYDNNDYDIYALAKIEKYNITWKKFGDATQLPVETFYIRCEKSDATRLNVVWLDGSEEDQVTAIKSVKSANAENGAIYNLAGQKVNAAYKGVVIKDGKKYMQK